MHGARRLHQRVPASAVDKQSSRRSKLATLRPTYTLQTSPKRTPSKWLEKDRRTSAISASRIPCGSSKIRPRHHASASRTASSTPCTRPLSTQQLPSSARCQRDRPDLCGEECTILPLTTSPRCVMQSRLGLASLLENTKPTMSTSSCSSNPLPRLHYSIVYCSSLHRQYLARHHTPATIIHRASKLLQYVRSGSVQPSFHPYNLIRTMLPGLVGHAQQLRTQSPCPHTPDRTLRRR
jgi:hypothetical protein